jgi:glutamate N-acetyltransferase/amino-acid N-acetyltransferase
MNTWPRGFTGLTQCVGLKDTSDDYALVVSTRPTTSSAVFTRSRFAGPSVVLSRQIPFGTIRGIVALSKNANVATGADGLANAMEIRERSAALGNIAPEQLLIASTGVIGVQYPMPTVRERLSGVGDANDPIDFEAAARAIMTTDTRSKCESRSCGQATITGIAKGVGMIEPNMATMLAFFFTDAEISASELDEVFRRVVDTTFNAVSIDTDTSTSDTASIIANGAAGLVDLAEFETALHDCALALVKQIASDGEGASKLIQVDVRGARDDAQAKRVAKTVVNSPLVKTAIHGADPNWGRVTMAIGKCEDDLDIEPTNVRLWFGDSPVFPNVVSDDDLAQLRSYLSGNEVTIGIDLGIGQGSFTVYGCDLTEGYIRLNADYTT